MKGVYMHNAHIVYKFKEGKLEEGVKIWEEAVFDKIKNAEGFVRVQLYTRENEMMAIGTWKEKSYAENFMKTGVFKDIMGHFGELLEETPMNQTYELRYFESK
jgi:quinol monooxygenase YgiN